MIVGVALTVGMLKGCHFSIEGNERGTLSVKMVFKRERGWIGGATLFKYLLIKYPHGAGRVRLSKSPLNFFVTRSVAVRPH